MNIKIPATIFSIFSLLIFPASVTCSQFNWAYEIVANSVSDSNQVTSIALDKNNNPAISYYDLLGDRFLRYAKKNSDGTWNYDTVDANRNSGDYSSLQLNPVTGLPELSYIGGLYSGPTTLNFAQFDGTSWSSNTLASGVNEVSPHDTSLGYNPFTNMPAIAYPSGQWAGFMEYDGASWVGGPIYEWR